MFCAPGWLAVLLLLALWSSGVWPLHALGAWAVSSAGTVAEAAARDAASRLPDWLAPWLPTELARALESMV